MRHTLFQTYYNASPTEYSIVRSLKILTFSDNINVIIHVLQTFLDRLFMFVSDVFLVIWIIWCCWLGNMKGLRLEKLVKQFPQVIFVVTPNVLKLKNSREGDQLNKTEK